MVGKRYLVAAVLAVEVLALLVAFGDEALVSLGIVTPPGDFASLMAGAELLPITIVLLVATAAVLVGRRHGKVAGGSVISTVSRSRSMSSPCPSRSTGSTPPTRCCGRRSPSARQRSPWEPPWRRSTAATGRRAGSRLNRNSWRLEVGAADDRG